MYHVHVTCVQYTKLCDVDRQTGTMQAAMHVVTSYLGMETKYTPVTMVG